MDWLRDRTWATLAGAAIGDALGGATEGWTPDQIRQRHGGPVTGIVGPYYPDWRDARPIAPYHKGDGHITDDTLLTHALVQVYATRRTHLDAYAVASDLVPLLIGERVWIPELEAHALLLQRLFLAEKWLVARLHYGHVDPREAGVGNIVNCGAAMYMAPVGVVNAADPAGAYAEAIDLAGAHQSSYGREAAGVFAAAVAAALQPGATIAEVVAAAVEVAHDGTRAAIEAVAAAARELPADASEETVRLALRSAVRPYDTVGEDYRAPSLDARRPSRTKSIEELPVALGFCLAHAGELRPAVLGAVNYGRDADSIATMAGAICAALGGSAAVPPEWVQQVQQASRIDLDAVADQLATAAAAILAADLAAVELRRQRLGQLTAPAAPAASVDEGAPSATGLTWVRPEDLLLQEFVQARAEGVDVTGPEQRWRAATGGSLTPPVGGLGAEPSSPTTRALAQRLLDEVDALPRPADPHHPHGLTEIEAGWPGAAAGARPDDLTARLHGAWLGRAAGCLLGKPVEKIPRAGIEQIAKETGNWPLTGYFTARGLSASTAATWPWNRRSAPTSLVENIDGMPEDDDLNYPMLNLALLERHGPGFTTGDVATAWLSDLPAARTFTAERIAYRNLLLAMPPEAAARRWNPFREWIGALIRGDVFGWVRPGDPYAAARLAWADARLSHTRNGIYGELWAAALTSTSLVGSDVTEVLRQAAAVIPAGSELATAVEFGTELGTLPLSLEARLDRLHEHYGHLHWVHVLNNAATIACALAASDGDFGAGVGFAVMAGWDTDSTAATVGSVLGGLLGASGLPDAWTRPLDNRIETSLPGGSVRIDELAARTTRLAERWS